MPRATWTWTAPPLEGGKRVQVWEAADGTPLEVDVDVSDLAAPLPAELDFDFRPINLSRVITPRLDEFTLAALVLQCRERS